MNQRRTTKKVSAKTKKNSTGSARSSGTDSAILRVLQERFEANPSRHRGISWSHVEARLHARPEKLRSLNAMEESGGEPDVVGLDPESGEVLFFDCSAESPAGRRSVCFDRAALESRRENKPKASAEDLAARMGIEILTEEQYRKLQALGTFDAKTSSWIQTPKAIRKLGGALFCDHRYGAVFTYHNGAESYYAARGFRGCLHV